jgi:hypothetical protein
VKSIFPNLNGALRASSIFAHQGRSRDSRRNTAGIRRFIHAIVEKNSSFIAPMLEKTNSFGDSGSGLMDKTSNRREPITAK